MSLQELKFRIPYHEVDRMGFLHHSKYFAYFEIGRTELLRSTGLTYKEVEDKGILLVVANLSCKYKYPIQYDDIITVITKLKRMTFTKIEHIYEMWDDKKERLHALGESTLACLNKNGELQKIPDFLSGFLTQDS